ncbi:IclR family transcriptional regulator [Ramlibacter sp. USB13]|uniref:IclR family transcriptional regulator n=1 Tax=Ramlibacter cellulosilyticus TaxID=2764187 RepID=A0A923MT97_9BURK|nr:IclR family transcriptional regulator [Ramlibacter cellulosilyticus]MBC5784368.1 IclR family transcriptional regulator [Ramlibacter cellulosilyticus]
MQATEESVAAVAKPDTVSALERGIAVLRCFTETRRTLTSTELSRLTGVPRPTVTRLASTLVTLGLMKQEPEGDRYMLGPGVVSLARVFLAGLDVRAIARPHMQALAEEAGGSVYLAVPDGLEMVIVEACRPRTTMLAPRLDVGSRAPIANSALGRAYLWALFPEERARLIETLRLSRGSDWAALEPPLKKALEEGDRLGYCISAGEFHREINSVSVPLVGPNGEVMSLNCGTAAFVYTEDHLRQEIAPRLLKMAGALAADIGGHVPAPR